MFTFNPVSNPCSYKTTRFDVSRQPCGFFNLCNSGVRTRNNEKLCLIDVQIMRLCLDEGSSCYVVAVWRKFYKKKKSHPFFSVTNCVKALLHLLPLCLLARTSSFRCFPKTWSSVLSPSSSVLWIQINKLGFSIPTRFLPQIGPCYSFRAYK